MRVSELRDIAGMTVLACDELIKSREIENVYIGDLLSRVMGRARPGDCWITIMPNVNVAAVAVLCDCACVVLCEGVVPDADLLARASEREVLLLGSDKSAYELACILKDALR